MKIKSTKKTKFEDLFKDKNHAVRMYLNLENRYLALNKQYEDMYCSTQNCENRTSIRGQKRI